MSVDNLLRRSCTDSQQYLNSVFGKRQIRENNYNYLKSILFSLSDDMGQGDYLSQYMLNDKEKILRSLKQVFQQEGIIDTKGGDLLVANRKQLLQKLEKKIIQQKQLKQVSPELKQGSTIIIKNMQLGLQQQQIKPVVQIKQRSYSNQDDQIKIQNEKSLEQIKEENELDSSLQRDNELSAKGRLSLFKRNSDCSEDKNLAKIYKNVNQVGGKQNSVQFQANQAQRIHHNNTKLTVFKKWNSQIFLEQLKKQTQNSESSVFFEKLNRQKEQKDQLLLNQFRQQETQFSKMKNQNPLNLSTLLLIENQYSKIESGPKARSQPVSLENSPTNINKSLPKIKIKATRPSRYESSILDFPKMLKISNMSREKCPPYKSQDFSDHKFDQFQFKQDNLANYKPQSIIKQAQKANFRIKIRHSDESAEKSRTQKQFRSQSHDNIQKNKSKLKINQEQHEDIEFGQWKIQPSRPSIDIE